MTCENHHVSQHATANKTFISHECVRGIPTYPECFAYNALLFCDIEYKHTEGNKFLCSITRDESWVQHSQPENKR
jgi:hypothetical protein